MRITLNPNNFLKIHFFSLYILYYEFNGVLIFQFCLKINYLCLSFGVELGTDVECCSCCSFNSLGGDVSQTYDCQDP